MIAILKGEWVAAETGQSNLLFIDCSHNRGLLALRVWLGIRVAQSQWIIHDHEHIVINICCLLLMHYYFRRVLAWWFFRWQKRNREVSIAILNNYWWWHCFTLFSDILVIQYLRSMRQWFREFCWIKHDTRCLSQLWFLSLMSELVWRWCKSLCQGFFLDRGSSCA